MAVAAFFAFLFGATLGIYMAVNHFRGVESGKATGIVHGLWNLSGIALLAAGLGLSGAGWGWWVLVAFLVTASGGLYLGYRQMKGKPWPSLVILAHGGLAIASIIVLGLWIARPDPDGGVPAVERATEGVERDPVPADAPSLSPQDPPATDRGPVE